MTSEQVMIAARKYCEMAGQDPDAMVPLNDKADCAILTAQWHLAADKIRDLDMIVNAVGFVMDGYPQ